MRAFWTVWMLGIVVGAWGVPARGRADAEVGVRRVAVVVGANAAGPGRRPLRYAHDDARDVADVLRSVARLDPDDVHVMLDPAPDAVLARLDAVVADLSRSEQPSMLLFYYSGHADDVSLFPAGAALPLRELQRRLDDTGVGVRLGILDACRGGGWTGARGLTETEAFEVGPPIELSSEGSVLIASSSGLEDAHESEALRGGFFTHHWNAALRGAADRNGDHRVTLQEALDYAKALTIRDTALRTEVPQHPSYQIRMRGRHDLTLTRLVDAPTTLSLEQERGPLQLVSLDRGLVVLETPAGARSLRVSLPPGDYLVRAHDGGSMRATTVQVRPGVPAQACEQDLQPSDAQEVATRGGELRPVLHTTLRDRDLEMRLALGVRHGMSAPGIGFSSDTDVAAIFQWSYGVTDRWQWFIPGAMSYRFGDSERLETVLWGGLESFMLGGSSVGGFVLRGAPGFGANLRRWLQQNHSLIFGLEFDSEFTWQSRGDVTLDSGQTVGSTAPTTWRGRGTFGYRVTLANVVTLGFSLAWEQNLLWEGRHPAHPTERGYVLGLGSVQSLGLRSLPVISVHVSDVFSIDGYVGLERVFAESRWRETYMLGITLVW